MISPTSTAASYCTSTASRLQTSLQMPHLMQSSWSIVCGCFFSPEIASSGQRTRAERAAVAALRVDAEADERLADPGRAALVVDVRLVLVAEVAQRRQHRVGRGRAERAQRRVFDRVGQLLEQVDGLRRAAALGDVVEQDRAACASPSRHGVHLPHDSSLRKRRKYRATSTMQVCSSITIMPPEPIIEPASASACRSRSAGRAVAPGRQPPDGPPVCTALNALPSGIPPPMS